MAYDLTNITSILEQAGRDNDRRVISEWVPLSLTAEIDPEDLINAQFVLKGAAMAGNIQLVNIILSVVAFNNTRYIRYLAYTTNPELIQLALRLSNRMDVKYSILERSIEVGSPEPPFPINPTEYSKLIVIAARYGRDGLVNYFRTDNTKLLHDALENAAYGNHKSTVILISSWLPDTSLVHALTGAAEGNHLDLLQDIAKVMTDSNVQVDNQLILDHATSLDIITIAINMPGDHDLDLTVRHAIRAGKLDTVLLLDNTYNITYGSIHLRAAVRSGNLELVKFIQSKVINTDKDVGLIAALEHDKIAIIEYYLAKGIDPFTILKTTTRTRRGVIAVLDKVTSNVPTDDLGKAVLVEDLSSLRVMLYRSKMNKSARLVSNVMKPLI